MNLALGAGRDQRFRAGGPGLTQAIHLDAFGRGSAVGPGAGATAESTPTIVLHLDQFQPQGSHHLPRLVVHVQVTPQAARVLISHPTTQLPRFQSTRFQLLSQELGEMQHFHVQTASAGSIVHLQGVGALGAGGDDAPRPCFAQQGNVEFSQLAEILDVPFPQEIVATAALVGQDNGLDAQVIEHLHRAAGDLQALRADLLKEHLIMRQATHKIDGVRIGGGS